MLYLLTAVHANSTKVHMIYYDYTSTVIRACRDLARHSFCALYSAVFPLAVTNTSASVCLFSININIDLSQVNMTMALFIGCSVWGFQWADFPATVCVPASLFSSIVSLLLLCCEHDWLKKATVLLSGPGCCVTLVIVVVDTA